MDVAISRLKKLSDRIESRIIKFEERGIDMTEARNLLENARESIASAIDSIDAAFENARKALETDVSRDSFGKVVSELTKAKKNLREAHASLVKVIRVMKSNLPDNKIRTNVGTSTGTGNATTSVETN